MQRSCGGQALLDEFAYFVHLYVVFISKVVLPTFLSPSCIHVLLPLLVGIVVPQIASVAIWILRFAIEDSLNLLHILILVSGIMLLGSQHKACVDNLALVEDQSLCIELIDKLLE